MPQLNRPTRSHLNLETEILEQAKLSDQTPKTDFDWAKAMFESKLISIIRRNRSLNQILSSPSSSKIQRCSSTRVVNDSTLVQPSKLFSSSATSELIPSSGIGGITARNSVIINGFRSFLHYQKVRPFSPFYFPNKFNFAVIFRYLMYVNCSYI